MQIFILFSAIGLVLSVIVHICVLLGIPNPLNEAAWLLHIGIFVVWFPAVIVSCKWKNTSDDLTMCHVCLSEDGWIRNGWVRENPALTDKIFGNLLVNRTASWVKL